MQVNSIMAIDQHHHHRPSTISFEDKRIINTQLAGSSIEKASLGGGMRMTSTNINLPTRPKGSNPKEL